MALVWGVAGAEGEAVSDPFLITGPAVVSFSGGRTSAYMLWRILQAHGGTLPDDVVVCFDNTGAEMPATLDFVRDCSEAWNVKVRWLEYRFGSNSDKPFTAEVSYESASRDHEPFEALLGHKRVLPNPANNMCSIELKMRTTERFIRSEYGWDHWVSVVGLRADEPKKNRAPIAIARGQSGKDRWSVACPLFEAGIVEDDVMWFWSEQPFDLRLSGPEEGNCAFCFKKKLWKIERMMRRHPERAVWWIAQEARHQNVGLGARFRADRDDYAVIARTVRDQGRLHLDPYEREVFCDEACGA